MTPIFSSGGIAEPDQHPRRTEDNGLRGQSGTENPEQVRASGEHRQAAHLPGLGVLPCVMSGGGTEQVHLLRRGASSSSSISEV